MAISPMLKMQLLGHASVKEDVKRYLRERGAVEVTDFSIEKGTDFDDEGVREIEELLEITDAAILFLDGYTERLSMFKRIGSEPLSTSAGEIDKILEYVCVKEVWRQCSDLQGAIRGNRDEIARSGALVNALEPWKDLGLPLEETSTEVYITQFWTVPEKAAETGLGDVMGRFPLAHFEECNRLGGRSYTAVILPRDEAGAFVEEMKELGCFLNSFGDLDGKPAEIIDREKTRRRNLEEEIGDAERRARGLAVLMEKLRVLSDYYRECAALRGVDKHLHHTDSTFVLEGWIRAADRRNLEKHISKRYRDVEISFRPARKDEEPPIHLVNNPVSSPYEFVTTLYGRPVYGEVDPTPHLAPFFVLFFALCLTDAGYGLTLAGVSALLLVRFKLKGGAGKLMRLLFMGGLATAVIGVVTGGIFGIDVDSFPALFRNFVFINPLEEPMKMLNIAFLMGLVHMLFGMGIRMVANIRARLISEAILDDLLWILFLIALAPLGFSAILGGEVPQGILLWSKNFSIVIAIAIFLTGGRKQRGIVKKFFKGLIGFYDVVGYFGDVLSYARLLALGLATSAIALAVNGIADMVKGLPFYTGYIAAVLILVLGHGFNLAVNTLGAFVHSGRLQYLEFFSKFFNGGGREFRPFMSERQYSVMKDADNIV